MIQLSHETEILAERLAALRKIAVDDAVRQAIEASVRIESLTLQSPRRRMKVEQMLAIGKEIAALPLLDPRSPQDIADDLDSL